ncbi:MAG: hypothetical protein PHX83_04035 [Acidobacteriia bacterium]|nr:hypothetical protein [Terriglobia bacterium]
MKQFRLLFLCVILILFNTAVFTQAPPAPTAATLKPGAMVKCQLDGDLSSTSISKGDMVDFKILFATDDGKRVVLPHGSKLQATVTQAKSALKERIGTITLKLTQLILPDGHTEPVQGSIQFMALKEVTVEPNDAEVTLEGKLDESSTMSIQSSTSMSPPPSNADDMANGDIKNPERSKKQASGSLDLTRKKGHDVEIPSGTTANIKILEPSPAASSKPAPNAHP